MSQPQLLSGARGLIEISGTGKTAITLAAATDINVNVRATVRDTYVMGRLNVVGLDTTAIDCDVSIGRVVPVNKMTTAGTETAAADKDSTKSTYKVALGNDANGAPVDGSDSTYANSLGLEENIENILNENDITIRCYDKITGKTIGAVKGARFSGRSMSVDIGGVATERLNFVGIFDAGYAGEGNSATDAYGLG